MQEELVRLEKKFAHAVVSNDADAVGPFFADDWVMVGPDERIIDKSRFLEVIKSGASSHEMMESDDLTVRLYGSTAIVTALTVSKGKFMGAGFRFVRAGDGYFCEAGRSLAVRIYTAYPVYGQVMQVAPNQSLEPTPKAFASSSPGRCDAQI
jgi:hypothetical protein